MLKQNKLKVIISSVIILLPALFGLVFWDKLPEKLVTHWGADGNPDGSMVKGFAVFAIPLILLALHLICLAVASFDKKNKEQSKKVVGLVFWIIPMVSLLCGTVTYSAAMGKEMNTVFFVFLLLAIMFIMIGNYLPKAKQNSTFGIKLYYTLHNEENWNKTHRFSGKLWFCAGILILISAFIPRSIGMPVLFAVIIAVAVIPMLYSYLLYRRQKAIGEFTDEKYIQSKAEKTAFTVSAFICAAVLVGAAVIMLTGDIDIDFDDDYFEIEADFCDDIEVMYSDIESVELNESGDPGYRSFGFGSPRLSMGRYESESYGYHTRYTYSFCKTEIVIRNGDDILVINDRTPELTKRLFKEILKRIE